jgi:hypothetical protein
MKNALELKALHQKKKITSSNFNKVYDRILDAFSDEQSQVEITDVILTKGDIETLKGLQFKVDIIKTHGILGTGRSEKYVISWS